VFGSIVSTAEKARDGAKRALSSQPPSPESAYQMLVRCFEDQQSWEGRHKTCKELMQEMLHFRYAGLQSCGACCGCSCGWGVAGSISKAPSLPSKPPFGAPPHPTPVPPACPAARAAAPAC
jgi:hypothetical protein